MTLFDRAGVAFHCEKKIALGDAHLVRNRRVAHLRVDISVVHVVSTFQHF